jgi:hypothetical protein
MRKVDYQQRTLPDGEIIFDQTNKNRCLLDSLLYNNKTMISIQRNQFFHFCSPYHSLFS